MSYEENVQQPAQTYQAPVMPQPNGTPILIMGIISLVVGSIVGIILSIIGKKKASEIVAMGYPLTGTAKVGSILCNIGLIVSILTTVFYALYFLIVIIGAIAGAASSSYYYY